MKWKTEPITEEGTYIVVLLFQCGCCFDRIMELSVWNRPGKYMMGDFSITSDTHKLDDVLIDGRLYYSFWCKDISVDDMFDSREFKYLEVEKEHG